MPSYLPVTSAIFHLNETKRIQSTPPLEVLRRLFFFRHLFPSLHITIPFTTSYVVPRIIHGRNTNNRCNKGVNLTNQQEKRVGPLSEQEIEANRLAVRENARRVLRDSGLAQMLQEINKDELRRRGKFEEYDSMILLKWVPVIHVATSGLRLLEIAFVSDFLLIASVPVPFLSVMVNITHSQAKCGRMLIYCVRNCINITKSL